MNGCSVIDVESWLLKFKLLIHKMYYYYCYYYYYQNLYCPKEKIMEKLQ